MANPYELFLPAKRLRPQGARPYPLVLILPVLGRILFLPDLLIEKVLARFFSRHGYAAAVVRRGFFSYRPGHGIEQVAAYLRQSVEKTREALGGLAAHPEIDAHAMVSLGISFGGVIGVLLAAEEPRLKAHVFALAGGNIPEILTTSRDPLVRAYCRELLRGLNLDKKSFVAVLREKLDEEPLKVASQVDPRHVLMITARLDRVVFPRYALALREALGKPETLFLPVGHYAAMLLIPYLERKTLEFFNRKLYNAATS